MYTFEKSVREIMAEGRHHSVEKVYNKLSPKAQEFITRENVETIYQAVEEEVELNLLMDDIGQVYGVLDSNYFDEVVFKFMKAVKAMKRGSQVTNWTKEHYPNFSDDADNLQYNVKYYSEVMDFDKLFENTKVKGKAQRRVILNLLFSLYLQIEVREYHELSKGTQFKQFKQFVENVSQAFIEVKNDK